MPGTRKAATLSLRMQPQTSIERRSGRVDRRRDGPARPPNGLERRSGERRRLPRSRWQQWPSLLASAALGVVAAVLLQSIGGATPATRGDWVAALPDRVAPPISGPSDPGSVPAPLPRFSADEAAALRDEAERLTPAAVALDERAALRWWPLLGELAAAEADPVTPEPVRIDLHATREALERVGL